jgi:4-hydroxybenzoate polyprenyltransferase
MNINGEKRKMKVVWKELKNFIIHLRLPFQLVMFFIFLTGFVVGGYSNISNLILGAIIVYVFISGGTVAYNSYYDKDEGPVNFIKNPPKPTKSLLVLSIIFKMFGIILAPLINFNFFIICVVCVFMSIFYSHPKFRLKTKNGLDLVINGVGYGSLSILGGWLCVTSEINFKIIFLSIIAFFLISTGLPLTQIFQYDDDKKKDGKTFVVIFGPKKSLLISLILLFITLILFNVFFVIYFNFLFNIVISMALLPGFFFIYSWFKNLMNINNAKIFGNPNIGVIGVCAVFIVLILFG